MKEGFFMEVQNKVDSLTPYQKIALTALQERIGMSFEKALQTVSACTTEDKINALEAQIGAKGSIEAALLGIATYLDTKYNNLTQYKVKCERSEDALNKIKNSSLRFFQRGRVKAIEKDLQSDTDRIVKEFGDNPLEKYEKLDNFVWLGRNNMGYPEILSQGVFYGEDISKVTETIKSIGLDGNQFALYVLDCIHSNWIDGADKSGKFFEKDRENSRFQFMDSAFIGFDELKKDLIFAQPILEALGIEFTEESLKRAYDERVRQICELYGIDSRAALIDKIEAGGHGITPDSAPDHESFKENRAKRISTLSDPLVAEQIAEQIMEHNPIITQIFEEKAKNNQMKNPSFGDKIRSSWNKILSRFTKPQPSEQNSQNPSTFSDRRANFTSSTEFAVRDNPPMGETNSNDQPTHNTELGDIEHD